MFELLDNFVTLVLTAMVYGIPFCMLLMFVHFVVMHPAPQSTVAQPEQALETLTLTVEPVEPVEPVELVESQEIVCEPVAWRSWRVSDLRQPSIRQPFKIQIRQSNQMLKKQALIDQYKAAFSGMAPHRASQC